MPEKQTIFNIDSKKKKSMTGVVEEGVEEINISGKESNNKKSGNKKDTWHWDEKDLGSLVDAKLAAMFADKAYVNKKDAEGNHVIIKTTEAKQEGEAFLSRRKGKMYCTYNLKITVNWHGKLMVGSTEIGFGAGRFVLPEVSYDNCDPSKWQMESDFDRTGGFGACLNPSMKTRELTEYEEQLMSVAEAEIGPEVRKKAQEIVECLQEALAKAQKGEKVLVELDTGADEVAKAEKAERDAKAAAYGRELHLQMVGKKYFSFINGEDPELTDVSLSCCSIDDEDLVAVLEVLKSERGQNITSLDLSFNSLEDGGLQQICAALGSGAAPRLKVLRLGHNMKFSEKVSKGIVRGLKLLRKAVDVQM